MSDDEVLEMDDAVEDDPQPSVRLLFNKAHAEGRTEHLTVRYVTFEEAGDEIIGRFVKQELVPESRYNCPVQKYTLDTDEGLVCFVLGSATDKELAGRLRAGDIIRVKYRGQAAIDPEQTIPIFDVERVVEKEVQ